MFETKNDTSNVQRSCASVAIELRTVAVRGPYEKYN